MANPGITADGPILMMSSDGSEIAIPLSALYVGTDGAVHTDKWPGFAHYPNDQAVITAYLQQLLVAGTIGPVPPPQPQPAMLVRAASPGAAGNAISVLIGNVAANADPTKATFDVSVSTAEQHTGLTTATVETQLGSDQSPSSQPGLVDVIHDSVDTAKSPVTKSYTLGGASGGPKPQLALVDATAHAAVTLEANHLIGTTAVQVSNADPNAKTFSLKVTWSETVTKTYKNLSVSTIKATLDADPAALVTVPAPPPGSKPPQPSPPAAAYTLDAGTPHVTVEGTDANPSFDLASNELTGTASITFGAASSDDVHGTFPMTVTQQGATETEQYDGVSLDTIEALLGTSAAPVGAPKLVEVVANSVVPGAVVAGPTGATSFPPPALVGQSAQAAIVDGSGNTVFVLEANDSSGTTTVDVTSHGGTFDLAIAWTLGTTGATIGTLATAAAKFAGVVTVQPPAGGAFAVPAQSQDAQHPTPLTGGADGAFASATLFTAT